MKLKWKLESFFRRSAISPNGLHITIGKDSGSMGINTYYYIEIDDEVVEHGFTRLKDAKEYLINNYELE